MAIKDYRLDSGEREGYLVEDRIATDHLARYYFAAQFISRRCEGDMSRIFVADVFCGVGYGSNILARETGVNILAIDGSEDSIIKANNFFPRSNIIFSSKIFPFQMPKGVFDYVCSFESLEHILDYRLFAEVLVQSLKPGGYLFASCPNSERNSLELNPWHWHYKHQTPSEFASLFVDLGMTVIAEKSTLCSITDFSGRVVGTNHYAIPKGEVLDTQDGDTMFFVLQKGGK